jgi:actin related protein 2/3 complex subunit 3
VCALPGSSDRTLIYLTLYINACLRKLESVSNLAAAQKVRGLSGSPGRRGSASVAHATRLERGQALYTLAVEPFSIPGDAQWPLGGLFSPPATKEEAGALTFCRIASHRIASSLLNAHVACPPTSDVLRAYLKQAREEVGLRLAGRCFTAEGQPNKWWMAFSRRKFMNAELR